MKPKELKLALERGYTHTSLRLALQEPNNVYKLKLRGISDRLVALDKQKKAIQDTIDNLDTLFVPNKEKRIKGYQALIKKVELQSITLI